MKAGVSTFAFGWAVQAGRDAAGAFDEQALVAFAVRHGVPVVQLADNLAAHAMAAGRLDAFVTAAIAGGLTIELGARRLTAAHLDTYLALCHRCGSRLLRFVVDDAGYEPTPETLIELLSTARPRIEAAGVVLALENHDRFSARTLRRIVDAVGSPAVGVCLDTANSLGAGEGLGEVVRELAALTVNLHVKDVAIRRVPHLMGFTVEGRALGRGQLPIRDAIARIAAEAGPRCGTAVLEGWTPPVAAAEDEGFRADAALHETVRTELAWAEESIVTLQGWLADGGYFAASARPIA